MPRQKYEIRLTGDDKTQLMRVYKSKSKNISSETRKRAKAILLLDLNSDKPLTPEQTASKCGLHRETVYGIRKEFVDEGFEIAINRKKRITPPVPPKITGDIEAHIITIACSVPPEGKSRWTLQMIADKVVLDGHLESISDVAIMNTLKKLNLSLI
jgi:hypothetical protein